MAAPLPAQAAEGDEVKTGWLERIRPGGRLDRRFCALHNDPALAYFEDDSQEPAKCKGVAGLRGAKVKADGEQLLLDITGENGRQRPMHFKAASSDDAGAWAAAIQKAIEQAPPRMTDETMKFLESVGDLTVDTSTSKLVSMGRRSLGRASGAALDLSGEGKPAHMLRSSIDFSEGEDEEGGSGSDADGPQGELHMQDGVLMIGDEVVSEDEDEAGGYIVPGSGALAPEAKPKWTPQMARARSRQKVS